MSKWQKVKVLRWTFVKFFCPLLWPLATNKSFLLQKKKHAEKTQQRHWFAFYIFCKFLFSFWTLNKIIDKENKSKSFVKLLFTLLFSSKWKTHLSCKQGNLLLFLRFETNYLIFATLRTAANMSCKPDLRMTS